MKILTQTGASAVMDALTALSSIGISFFSIKMGGEESELTIDYLAGSVTVTAAIKNDKTMREIYSDIKAFAFSYDLV